MGNFLKICVGVNSKTTWREETMGILIMYVGVNRKLGGGEIMCKFSEKLRGCL